MKFAFEIEITSFCTLSCGICINKKLKNKNFLSRDLFIQIIDYLYLNKSSIIIIDLAWIWDIFLHKDIDFFLNYICDKFKSTDICILIPTKLSILSKKNISLLSRIISKWLKVDIQIGLFSINSIIHDYITWTKGSFHKTMKNLNLLRKENIRFSLELVLTRYSLQDIDRFKEFSKRLWVGYEIIKLNSYAWSLKKFDYFRVNSSYFKECKWKSIDLFTYSHENFFCNNLMPMISSSGDLFMCSHWRGKKEFNIWNSVDLFKLYPDIKDLFDYIKRIMEKEYCWNCPALYEKI